MGSHGCLICFVPTSTENAPPRRAWPVELCRRLQPSMLYYALRDGSLVVKLAVNITFQFVYRLLLHFDNVLHQIANRNDADDSAAFYDG